MWNLQDNNFVLDRVDEMINDKMQFLKYDKKEEFFQFKSKNCKVSICKRISFIIEDPYYILIKNNNFVPAIKIVITEEQYKDYVLRIGLIFDSLLEKDLNEFFTNHYYK